MASWTRMIQNRNPEVQIECVLGKNKSQYDVISCSCCMQKKYHSHVHVHTGSVTRNAKNFVNCSITENLVNYVILYVTSIH